MGWNWGCDGEGSGEGDGDGDGDGDDGLTPIVIQTDDNFNIRRMGSGIAALSIAIPDECDDMFVSRLRSSRL